MLCSLVDVQLDWPHSDRWYLSKKESFDDLFVSLDIHPSSVYWMRGPNGVGKSTWLRVVSGLLPSSGRVEWVQEEFGRGLRESFFFVFSPDYDNADRVDRIIRQDYFARTGLILSERLLLEFLDLFSLQFLRKVKWGHLSLGQKKALQLLPLCYADRLVWVLDEPFVFLDCNVRSVVKSLIHRHLNLGGSVILVSHFDIDFADFTIFLQRGEK